MKDIAGVGKRGRSVRPHPLPQASDIALNEPRGVVYGANFAANRIDGISLAYHKTGKAISAAPYPGSLALSRTGIFC